MAEKNSDRRRRFRELNNNWRGGRSVSSNGYVLLRVGIEHHLADVRGYAYEHRVVAEQKIGRRLQPGEQVHHVNGNTQDNRAENLEVCKNIKEHRRLHRNDVTASILEFIAEFPCTRLQLSEYLGIPGRQIGWALSRLRKNGIAFRTEHGSWVS